MRFHCLIGYQHCQFDCGHCYCDWGAKAGYGYWFSGGDDGHASDHQHDFGFWLTAAWVPRKCHTGGLEFRSMIPFWRHSYADGLVVYVANNFEKIYWDGNWGVDRRSALWKSIPAR